MNNNRLTLIVARTWERTFAVVHATVSDEWAIKSQGPGGPGMLFKADIEEVLTRWAVETEEGRAAWEGSSCDYNIGDLAGELGGDPPDVASSFIRRALAAKGIMGLSIDTWQPDQDDDSWAFDDILMDEGKIQEADEAKEKQS